MKRLLIFLQLILIFSAISAQRAGKISTSYTNRHFNLKNGLPSIQITCLFQDSRGFLWIGTKSGVCRWDGKEMKSFVYTHELNKQVASIQEDTQGRIWICYAYVNYISEINGVRTKTHKLPDSLKQHSAYVVIPYASDKFDIFTFCLEYKKRVNYLVEYSNDTIQKVKKIREFDGLLKVYADTIIYRKRISSTQYESKFRLYLQVKDQLIDSLTLNMNSSSLQYNFTGKGLMNPGFFQKYGQTIYVQTPVVNDGRIELLTDTLFKNYTNNSPYFQNVLNARDYYFTQYEIYAHGDNKYAELVDNKFPSITTALQDNEGNIWVGTEQGLYCYYHFGVKEVIFKLREHGFDDIWSMARTSDGSYFLSSYYSGFFKVNSTMTEWHEVNNRIPAPRKANGLQSLKGAFGTIAGSDNTVFLPHFNGFTIVKEKKYLFYPMPAAPEFYGSACDSDRHLLYLMNYYYVAEFDTRRLRVKKVTYAKDFGILHFMHIALDKNGIVYLAGNNKILRKAGENWQVFSDSLSSRCLTIDDQLTIWGINKSMGLFNFRDNKVQCLPQIPRIAMPLALTIWNKNWLIVGGGKELLFLDLQSYYKKGKVIFSYLGLNDGLDILEGGQNNFMIDNIDQSVYWCCSDKVIQFFPDKLIHGVQPRKPIIDEIRALDRSDSCDTQQIESETSIRFNLDFRKLVFKVISPCFTNNDNVVYRYKLQNYDDEWHYTPSNTIQYSSLKPGKYNLVVAASDGKSNFSALVVSKTLVIPGYIYESFWFQFTLMLLFLLGIVLTTTYLAYRRRLIKSKKMQYEFDNAQLQLSALRSKFTLHFSGNIYNAISYLIEDGQYEEANEYLLKFSRLNANIIRDSDARARSLKSEISLLSDFLSLEKFRYEDKFKYKIQIDENVNLNQQVPVMILHTFAENAIKHGIMSAKGHGSLLVKISNGDNSTLHIDIVDDGIGFQASKNLDRLSTRSGLKIIFGQIDLLNNRNDRKIDIKIADRFANSLACGTIVTIRIPNNFNYEI